MPPEGVPTCSHEDVLRFEEILRFVRIIAPHFGLSKVHLTGGEPLIREGLVDFIGELASVGAEDLALTTNGQLLADQAVALKKAGLNRVNVSLDSLRPRGFRRLIQLRRCWQCWLPNGM